MKTCVGCRAIRTGFLVALLLLASRGSALAAPDGARGSFCNTPMTSASFFASEASADLYNGLLWMGGTGALRFGADTSRRWSRQNAFDDGLRSALGGSSSTRSQASVASDVLLGFSVGVLPAAAIGKTLFAGDCEEAYDMGTDFVESVGLTMFATEVAKVVAGRERPDTRRCEPGNPGCHERSDFASFFSGHASLAAAGAGVSCSYAVRRRTWGDSFAARGLPCALGVGAAVTTGALRIVADRHWGTDVIVGLGVGMTVGYLDTWGPFDLLRFEVQPADRAFDLKGIVLPYAGGGQIGARISLTF